MSKFKEKFDELMKLDEGRQEIVDFDTDPYIQGIVNLCVSDMEATNEFLRTECTDCEFSELSQVFDEIVLKTNNKEFVDLLYQLAEKYPEETKDYNVMYFIDSAKSLLK